MDQIIRFFLSIGEAIISAFDFLVDTVEGIAYCVKLLGYFTANIPEYFGWLPSEFIVFVSLIFGIAVTYKIIGREG